MRRWGVEVMFSETLWDHEVDGLCIGAEGSVLAAGIGAARAHLYVYLGITQRTVAGALGASVGYAGGDRLTTRHIVGFDYAFGQVDRAQALWPLRTVDDISPSRSHHP